MQKVSIFWFRRDLRIRDNAGLYYALKSGNSVLPIFIFDTEILDSLEKPIDRRVEFIHNSTELIRQDLNKIGATLLTFYGKPIDIFAQIINEFSVAEVFANHDYEPYALSRDQAIHDLLHNQGISFKTYKDQCIFERQEILTDAGKPYTVFTPYSRKWKSKLNDFYLKPYPTEKYFSNFVSENIYLNHPNSRTIALEEMGFTVSKLSFPDSLVKDELIAQYAQKRDFPAIQGTSRLSVHLRFGTVSIRELAHKALKISESWLNELIWRDFYMMILANFPQVGEGKSFKKEYDLIPWRNNEHEFRAWCEGRTGYPIVDAGMRELNQTGFMHNRVRMITASFLVKHLLIDWRWGEAYFAKKLLDFDLSANNGGWQWAASSGCDAAPYFRIFNPTAQAQKFDTQLQYIKHWIPELNTLSYPRPIVEHNFARKRALDTFQKVLGKEKDIFQS
jgi:deoxyribodipyrimidine photo-lyase